MKALVTGSNGFLGASVVRSLLENSDCDVRCLIRPSSDRKRLDAVIAAHPQRRTEVIIGSLKSKSAASMLLDDVDVVYHLAAGMKGSAADLFLSSVIASKNLLEALVERGRNIRIVLVSSFGVYAAAKLPPRSTVDENTPLEPHPERRDLYSYAKYRQETLCWEYSERHSIPLVVLRPGVIYGPGGPAISSRVGLTMGPVFLHLGGQNDLPLTYVDNCADAIVHAGKRGIAGQAYNVLDDELPNCAQFLSRYRSSVKPMRVVSIPFSILMLISKAVQNYSEQSRGQLPPVFTPYKTLSSWKPARYTNAKLKSIGWEPNVATSEGLMRTFTSLRSESKDRP